MEKRFELKDGTDVIIRPLHTDDIDKSFAFFQALPEEDRAYLRVDVTKRQLVEQRIEAPQYLKVRRVVALVNHTIVADGALELEGHGRQDHEGEIRIIVARPYQRNGLGMLMARELFALAMKEQVEEIIVKVMRPQTGAQGIFRKLGFHEEITFPDAVKDVTGKKQDLIVMRCNLEGLWHEMEHTIAGSDWSYAP